MIWGFAVLFQRVLTESDKCQIIFKLTTKARSHKMNYSEKTIVEIVGSKSMSEKSVTKVEEMSFDDLRLVSGGCEGCTSPESSGGGGGFYS